MKRATEELEEGEWRACLGDLPSSELEEAKAALSGVEIDVEENLDLDRMLRALARDTATDESMAPSLPLSSRRQFEKRKASAMARVAREEAERRLVEEERRRRERRERHRRSPLRFLRPALTALGAVAAIMGASYLAWEGRALPGDQALVATSAVILTPSGPTGFTEPVFTWKADNGGVVRLEVVDPVTGDLIASLDRAYSPVRFSALDRRSLLAEGRVYRFVVMDAKGEEVLAESGFTTVTGGEGAPQRAGELDEVVAQCESYLAEGRPGDAWMIWAELTSDEKSDPRQQALKARVLDELGG